MIFRSCILMLWYKSQWCASIQIRDSKPSKPSYVAYFRDMCGTLIPFVQVSKSNVERIFNRNVGF